MTSFQLPKQRRQSTNGTCDSALCGGDVAWQQLGRQRCDGGACWRWMSPWAAHSRVDEATTRFGDGVCPVDLTEDSETSAQLLRTKSDAGILRRVHRRSPSDQRKIRRHRFSINGHFYNHKVAHLYASHDHRLLKTVTMKFLRCTFHSTYTKNIKRGEKNI